MLGIGQHRRAGVAATDTMNSNGCQIRSGRGTEAARVDESGNAAQRFVVAFLFRALIVVYVAWQSDALDRLHSFNQAVGIARALAAQHAFATSFHDESATLVGLLRYNGPAGRSVHHS